MDWFDEHTRQVQLNLLTFNANIGVEAVALLSMKILLQTDGGVLTQFDMTMVPSSDGSATNSLGIQITVILFVSILGLRALILLGAPLWTTGWTKGRQALDKVGVLAIDLGVTAFVFWHFVRMGQWETLRSDLFSSFLEFRKDPGDIEFTYMQKEQIVVRNAQDMIMFLNTSVLVDLVMVLLVTFQMLALLGETGEVIGQPLMGVVTRTLSSCFAQLMPLLTVFLLVTLTFGILGHISFGYHVVAFSTVWRSFGSVLEMLIGLGPDFDDLSSHCDFSTTVFSTDKICYASIVLYFWSYVIMNMILVLNMVLAVVFAVYDDVTETMREEKKKKSEEGERKLGIFESLCLVMGVKTVHQVIESYEKEGNDEAAVPDIDAKLAAATAAMATIREQRTDAKLEEIAAMIQQLQAGTNTTNTTLTIPGLPSRLPAVKKLNGSFVTWEESKRKEAAVV